MSTKRYGCPTCGSVEGFREINVALVDYNFDAFAPPDEEHPNPRVREYDDTSVDYEGAEPIIRGRFQCTNGECDQFFDEPAEIDEAGKPVEATGKPVADEDVIWSDRVHVPGEVTKGAQDRILAALKDAREELDDDWASRSTIIAQIDEAIVLAEIEFGRRRHESAHTNR